MDISALRFLSSNAVNEAYSNNDLSQLGTDAVKTEQSAFDGMLSAAMDNLGSTNAYLSDAENEEIKWAIGESESTHDLTNALQKGNISLQYTVAIRDKLLEAYKEIMQMQI